MKKIFFILSFIFISNILSAQNIKDSSILKKNSVFIEVGGSSFCGYSINYKRDFHLNKNFLLSSSLGFGLRLVGWKTKPLLFPFKITLKWNHFAIGLGTTNCVFFDKVSNETFIPKIIGIKYHPNDFSYYKVFYINTHPIIGYYFIDKNKYFLNAELSSFTLWSGDSENLFFCPMIGLNFGYHF